MAAPSSTPCKVAAVSNEASLTADDATLAERVAGLGDPVGVDTEFMRVRTFHPIPALYQLAGENGVTLVDAQMHGDLEALKTLLMAPAQTKIMHSASEDFEVMAHHLDLRPTNVVDTQVAHAFLAPDYSASYATLVEHYAGVQLGKHETRSDWLQRPLTAQQLTYASEDVLHLRLIWEKQRDALTTSGRLAWFMAEMRRILETPPATPQTWYLNLKGIWRLSQRQLAVLRSLVCWRECEARRRDLPRAWLVRDEALMIMAQRDSLRPDDLLPLLPKRTARRYADALIEAHRDGMGDESPPPRVPKPLGKDGNAIVTKLRGIVEAEAGRLGMAPPMLARRRDLEEALRHFRLHGELPAKFQDWRVDVVGDAFRSVLEAAR